MDSDQPDLRQDKPKRDRIAVMEARCNTGLDIVTRLSRRVRFVLGCVVVVLLWVGAVSCQSANTAQKTADLARDTARTATETAKVSKANRAAVQLIGRASRASCTQLANAIISAGAGPARKDGKLTDQQRLSVLRLTALTRAMTPAEKVEQIRLVQRVRKEGGIVIPDCEAIAKDPDSVVAIQQQEPRRRVLAPKQSRPR